MLAWRVVSYSAQIWATENSPSCHTAVWASANRTGFYVYTYISFEWSEPLKVSNSGALTAHPSRIMRERLLPTHTHTHTHTTGSRRDSPRFSFFFFQISASASPESFICAAAATAASEKCSLTNVDSCLFFFFLGGGGRGAGRRNTNIGSSVGGHTSQGHPATLFVPAQRKKKKEKIKRTNM